MNEVIIYALLSGIGTWFVTMLGAAVVIFFKNPNQKIMNLMLGFASGVMIAASFWSLLSPAIERLEERGDRAPIVVVVGFFVGAIFMWGSDKIVARAQRKTENGKDRMSKSIFMLVLSITLHNIPEGLAVGAAFGALSSGYSSEAFMGALVIAIGIGLQNFPEGAAVSLPMRREGYSRSKSFFVGQSSALVEPIFAFLGAYLVVYVEKMLPFALSFAAGAMILVAVHELIPECQKNNAAHPYFATFGIVTGFALMMFLDVLFS